jgi:hypothetical protein
MKRLLAAAALLVPIWLVPDLNCSKTAVAPRPDAPKIAEATPTPVPDLFASTVRPILLDHCAPCHEPGGVMYEKIPFDHPEVVASHSTGVLKRIKAPEERAAIERWLASQRS